MSEARPGQLPLFEGLEEANRPPIVAAGADAIVSEGVEAAPALAGGRWVETGSAPQQRAALYCASHSATMRVYLTRRRRAW